MSSEGDFPYSPILGMGCFDHQSYSREGSGLILRVRVEFKQLQMDGTSRLLGGISSLMLCMAFQSG